MSEESQSQRPQVGKERETMKIDLSKEEPKLSLSAADIKVMDRYSALMDKIIKYVPTLSEAATDSLVGLAKVINNCELSPTAPNRGVFEEEPQLEPEAPVTAG